jgi:hypothetical protein
MLQRRCLKNKPRLGESSPSATVFVLKRACTQRSVECFLFLCFSRLQTAFRKDCQWGCWLHDVVEG